MVIVPRDRDGRQIEEVDPEWVFSLVRNGDQFVELGGYTASLSSNKYKVLLKQRSCLACGIIGNRMFLEPHQDAEGYGFTLYAETKASSEHTSHLVLMTMDHILPLCRGGSDKIENLQTLCVNCNYIKAETDYTPEKIRTLMFLGYRSYKSSIALRLTRERLAPMYNSLVHHEKVIENIMANLDKVASEDGRCKMLARREQALVKVDVLRMAIKEAELTAQTTGVVPHDLKLD